MKEYIRKHKKEKGSVSLMGLFAALVFIVLLAFVIDGGLYYWQSSKLQNAVDATTIAVAHSIGDDDNAVRTTAETYLKANGFDPAKYGSASAPRKGTNYDVIYSYGSDKDMIIGIKKKGVAAVLGEDTNLDDDDYITSGYIKVTVQVKNNGFYKLISGYDGIGMSKSGFAKCEIDYDKMPDSLNFGIFGNSTDLTDSSHDMTVDISAPQGINKLQQIVDIFEGVVDTIENGFVKPIIGIFTGKCTCGSGSLSKYPDQTNISCVDSKGNTIQANYDINKRICRVCRNNPKKCDKGANYKKNTNFDIAHLTINTDVHSNGDINVGFGTIHSNRVKDMDYDGTQNECICQSECTADKKNIRCDVCKDNYRDCIGDHPKAVDYNIVKFHAVGKVHFSRSEDTGSSAKYADSFTQNYQYVEQTGATLKIIDRIQFKNVNSTLQLQNAYIEQAINYLPMYFPVPLDENEAYQIELNDPSTSLERRKEIENAKLADNTGETETVKYNKIQRAAILNQYQNLVWNNKTHYTLNNQKSIVYNTNDEAANYILSKQWNPNDGTTSAEVVSNNEAKGNVPTSKVIAGVAAGIDPAGTENTITDTITSRQDEVVFTKKNDDSDPGITLTVNYSITERGGVSVSGLDLNTTTPTASQSGIVYSLMKTAQQYKEYINIPNMKPYFVRTINKSVKNATTDNQADAASATSSCTCSKLCTESKVNDKCDVCAENYENCELEPKSVKGATASAQKNLQDLLDSEKTMVEGKDANDAESYNDHTYETSESVLNKNTTPLFSYSIRPTKGAADNEGNKDAGSFKRVDYDLLDSEGNKILNGEQVFDGDYLKTPDKYILDYKKSHDSIYGKDAVTKKYNNDIKNKYGSGAVSAKKTEFRNTKSYTAFKNSLPKWAFNANLPRGNNVFDAPVEDEVFLRDGSQLNTTLQTELAKTPTPALLDGWLPLNISSNSDYISTELGKVTEPATVSDVTFKKTVNVGTRTYVMKDIYAQTDGIKNAVKTFLTDNQMPDYHTFTNGYSSFSNVPGSGSGNNGSDVYVANTGKYNRINDRTAGLAGGRKGGFKADDNKTVFVNGVYYSQRGRSGCTQIEAGTNATLYIGNDNYKYEDTTADVFHKHSDGVKYVYFNGDDTGKMTSWGSNSKIYIYGHAYNRANVDIKTDALIYVKGDFKIDSTLNMETGATLIVTGKLTAKSIRANAGSKIYAKTVDNYDSSGASFGDLYVEDNVVSNGFTINESANVLVGGNYNASSGWCGLKSGAKFLVAGDFTNYSELNIADTTKYSIFVGGDTFNYFDNASAARTISADCAIGVKNFACSSLTNNGELYVKSGAALTISDFTNSGIAQIDRNVSGTNLTNNANAELKIVGNLTYPNITNSGLLIVTGNLIATTKIVQKNSNAKLFANTISVGNIDVASDSLIYSYGDVTATGKIGDDENSYTLYVKNGNVVADNISGKSVDIYVGKNLTVNGTLKLSGTLTNQTHIQVVGTIDANNISISAMVIGYVHFKYGSMAPKKVVVNEGEKRYLVAGEYPSATIENHGTIAVIGNIHGSNDLTLKNLVNVGAKSTFICRGSLTLTGQGLGDYIGQSLSNAGKVYIGRSIIANYTVANLGGIMYVQNNVEGANESSITKALYLANANNTVYIGGCIKSSANGIIEINSSATDSILSIYGGGNDTSIDSSVTTFENNSSSCTVYLGAGCNVAGANNKAIEFSSTFKNNGKVYVYACLKAGSATLSGANSSTIVAYDMTCDGLLTVGANSSARHILRVYGTLTTNSLTVGGASQVYALDKLVLNDNTFNILENGLVFCGENTDIDTANPIKITSTGDFKGALYYKGAGKTYSIECPSTFDGGIFVTDASITFGSSITMESNSKIYIGGTSTFSDCSIENTSGELYLIDAITTSGTCDLFKYNSGCTNYIAKINSTGIISLSNSDGAFNCAGNNYIDNSVVVNTDSGSGNKTDDKMAGRRWTTVFVANGETHLSGNLSINAKNSGTRINEGAKLSCNNFTTRSAIHDYGDFVILGNLSYTCSDEYADNESSESQDRGWCITVGKKDSANAINAMMFINGTNAVSIEGGIYNRGRFYANCNFTVNGNYVVAKSELLPRVLPGEINDTDDITRHKDSGTWPTNTTKYAPHFGIKTEANSQMHFAGNLSLECIPYTGVDSVLSVEGNLGYGQAILNGGVLYVKGNVGYSSNEWSIRKIEMWWASDVKGWLAFSNGYINNADHGNKNAVFFCGGSLTIGEVSNDKDKMGGSVQNFGSMYINGDLLNYPKDYSENAVTRNGAFNRVGLMCHDDSKTFINGEVNVYDSGVMSSRNSILMCAGRMYAGRCCRFGTASAGKGNANLSQSAYVYCGGDMLTSGNGRNGSGDLGVKDATWNYTEIHSNTNMYIGGSFFTYSIMNMEKGAVLVVDGKDSYNVKKHTRNANGTFTTTTTTVDNDATFDNFLGSSWTKFFENLSTEFKATFSRVNKNKIKFLIIGGDGSQEFGFETNGHFSSCYEIYVHGSTFVDSTFRYKDLSKMYCYGDFYATNTNTSRNVEIGKSLTSDIADVSMANSPLPTDPADADAKKLSPTYFYVSGDFLTRGRLNLYGNTTMRVGGDCFANYKIQLSQHASLFAGGTVRAKRPLGETPTFSLNGFIDGKEYSKLIAGGSILASNYLCMAEHSVTYAGKNIDTFTTIEGKSYSKMHAHGDMRARTSNIKIRDKSDVLVAGAMRASSFIELGKFDEKYKNTLETKECLCLTPCKSGSVNSECPHCKNNGYTACFAKLQCTCTEKCTSSNKNTNCEACKNKYESCEYSDSQCVCSSHCEVGHADENCAVCKSSVSNCAVLKNALGDDETDQALGGRFFIGQELYSTTGYIKEFGFSSVVVGKYVFTPKYLTLRSNADMWVLPEAFNNESYRKIAKEYSSDGTIWGEIKTAISKVVDAVVDAFTLKVGSVYSLGEITLNKNASLMGTYDCYAYDQTLLAHDALMYFGHDVKIYATEIQLDFNKDTPLVGFGSYGGVYETITCNNTTKHKKGHLVYTTKDVLNHYSASNPPKCDVCNHDLDMNTVKHDVTCPATIYANNDIKIVTSVDMRLTYMVAGNGDVTIQDAYSNSDNQDGNLKQLPNAIASYNGNINYNAMYGKICALFYAPNGMNQEGKGYVTMKGAKQEIWGSVIGHRVIAETVNLNIHRFGNWRTMNLHIAKAGSVYLVSERAFNEALDDVDDDFLYSTSTEDELAGGAYLFFDKSLVDAVKNGTAGEGASGSTGNGITDPTA